MQKIHSFRLVRFSKRFRHSVARQVQLYDGKRLKFRSWTASRPLVISGLGSPLCNSLPNFDFVLPTLKPPKKNLNSVFTKRFYTKSTMILSCQKNIVATPTVDPGLCDPYNLLDPGFLDYLFLTFRCLCGTTISTCSDIIQKRFKYSGSRRRFD